MVFLGNMIILLFSSLCIYLIFTLVKVLHKLWWTPIRIQNFMASQGIRGPSYRFIHGSTKEVLIMKKEAMAKPMTLSHNIFPKVLPQIYTWINTYGNNLFNMIQTSRKQLTKYFLLFLCTFLSKIHLRFFW
jgi:PHYB activation tagged suppressor 1